MNSNSCSVIPLFTCWYSGICLYFSKASSQCASVIGGMAPSRGFHSVIESPLSVSLVAPPTMTMQKISAAMKSSQART